MAIFRSNTTSGEAILSLRKTFTVYAVIFILWGMYRLLLRFPVIIEETIIKPLVLIPPVMSVLEQERSARKPSLRLFGFRRKGLLLAFYFGLTLGISYFLAVGLGSLIFSQREVFGLLQLDLWSLLSTLVIALFTAIWEQMVFSGFFLSRFHRVFRDEWLSVTMVGVLFTLLHAPILLLVSHMQFLYLIIQFVILFLVGFGNSVLMLRTKNIVAPILSHLFWAVAVQLVI